MERKEAIEKGLPRYFTGRPCKHGHLGERDTISAACLTCVKLAGNAAKERARETIKAAQGA